LPVTLLPFSLITGYNLSAFCLPENHLTSKKSGSSYLDSRFIPIGFQTEDTAGKESESIDPYKNSRQNIALLDGGKSIAYTTPL